MNQFLSLIDQFPFILVVDELNTKQASTIVMSKIIKENKKKILFIGIENFKEFKISKESVINEYERIFPKKDINWLKEKVNVKDHLIIFYSLSGIILRYGFENTINLIYDILEHNSLLCLVHSDLHGSMELENIKQETKACITIKKEKNYQIQIFSQRPKSKLMSSKDYYKIEKNDLTIVKLEKVIEVEQKKPDLSQIPFKLELSKQEEEARSNLVLPYQKNDENITAEDYEDDPDDDLDI